MNIYHTLNKSLCELFNVEYNPNEIFDYESNIEPFEKCRGGYFDMTGIPQSEEHKKARSKALKGNVNCGHMKGKTWSEETKRKMSESAKKRNQNLEYIKKQSEAKKGKPKSPEHIDKIIKSKTGMKLTEEHKRKISEGLKRRNVVFKQHNA